MTIFIFQVWVHSVTFLKVKIIAFPLGDNVCVCYMCVDLALTLSDTMSVAAMFCTQHPCSVPEVKGYRVFNKWNQ